MRNLRSSLLLILPLFAGCQILADLEYKEPVKKPSQRLQGEISREGDQWLLRPCQEQRRFVLSDDEGQDNLKDLASLAAEAQYFVDAFNGLQQATDGAQGAFDAFGGGAHVLDLGARKSVGWTSSQEWLAAALNGEDVDA